MFKELFPIAERGQLLLVITRDGERLRVHITQKKTEDDDFTPLNLALAATPEELDAELPMAIAEGAAMLSAEKSKSITEQVKGQVEQAKEAEEAGDKKSSTKTKVTQKKPAAAAKKPATPAKAKKPAAPKPPAKAKATPKKKRAQGKATAADAATASTPQITPLLTQEKLEAAAGGAEPAAGEVARSLDGEAAQVQDLAQALDYKAPEVKPPEALKTDADSVDLFGGA